MTITLTREEAQQVLDALQCATPPTFSAKIVEDWQSAVELLRARLSAPEPEPVMLMDAPLLLNGQPLYTAPPQREWQGLTDEEMRETLRPFDRGSSFSEKIRAIEAKLKEKNA